MSSIPFAEVDIEPAILRHPLIVSSHTSVGEVLTYMTQNRSSCAMPTILNAGDSSDSLLLTDDQDTCVLVMAGDRLAGIFTERDAIRLSAQGGLQPDIPISQVMSSHVVTIRESELSNWLTAIDYLQKHQIRHLPVVDSRDNLVGLLTQQSLQQLIRPIDLLRWRTAGEIMNVDMVCATPEKSLLHLVQLMAQHRVSCIVIVAPYEEKQDKKYPIGIVTEGDIVQFQVLGLDLATVFAQTVMSTPVFTGQASEDLWSVCKTMQQRRIRRLVFVGELGELQGIVTYTNLLQIVNPLELYKMVDWLQQRVSNLEAENLKLLENRNAELQQQVKERTTQLQAQAIRESAIASISKRIQGSVNLQEILASTLTEVRTSLSCDRVLVYRLHSDGTGTTLASSVTASQQPFSPADFHPPLQDSYWQGWYWSVGSGEIADLSTATREHFQKWQIEANVVLPILLHPQDTYENSPFLWGLLVVHQCERNREWQQEEVIFLEEVASQLAVAIRQANTYQELHQELAIRQQTERQLRQENAERRRTEQLLEELLESQEKLVGKEFEETLAGQPQLVKKLYTSYLQSQAVLASVTDVLLVVEKHGDVWNLTIPLTEVNNECTNSWTNATIDTIYGDDERFWESIEATFHDRRVHVLEYSIEPDSSGEPVWLEARIAPVFGNQVLWVARDITQRKQAQLSLQQERDRLQAREIELQGIFDLASVGIIKADAASGCLLKVNQKFCEFLNFMGLDVLQNKLREIFAVQNCDRDRQDNSTDQQILELAFDRNQETEQSHPLWIQMTVSTIHKSDGTPDYHIAILQDISDRKQAQTELQASRDMLQLVLDTIPQRVFWKDCQSRILGCNRNLVEDLGLPPEEIVGKRDRDLIPNHQIAEGYVRDDREVIATGEPKYRCQETWETSDGSIIYLETNKVPMRDLQGQIVGLLGTYEDVTDRVQAEIALKNSEANLKDFLDQAKDFIQMVSIDSQNFLYVNPAWQKTMGYTQAEASNMTFLDVVHPKHASLCRQIFESFQQGRCQSIPYVEVTFVTKEGREILLEGSINVRWENGNPAVTRAIFRDVTERRAAEKALSKLSERLQLAVKSAGIGIWEWDLTSDRLSWDQHMFELYDISPSSQHLCYQTWANSLHPEDRQRAENELQQALQGEREFDTEFRIVQNSGEVRFIKAHALVQFGKPNVPQRIIGVNFDISDRKRAEANLQQSEQDLRTIFNYAYDAILIQDFDGTILDVNDRGLEIFGSTRDRLIGSHVKDISAPDMPLTDVPAILQKVQAGASLRFEWKDKRLDNHRYFYVEVALRKANLGGRDLCIAAVRDISDRKLWEATLKRQLAAMEAAVDGIAILDNETYTYLNQAHVEIFGYEHAQELIGKTWKTLYPPAEIERIEQEVIPELIQNRVWQGETLGLRRDGSIFHLGISLTLLDDQTRICVCQDISDRKRYEENLRKTNQELERATRLKDEFLANMSHELRTPLNSILGMAEGLQEQIFGSLNERQMNAIATIEKSGRYLLELINDILDLSKIESGKLELHLEEVSIANICDTSLVFVGQMAHKKNIQLHKNIPDNLGTIDADNRRLRQILINLLTNAVKFTPEGGSVTLEVSQIGPQEQNQPGKLTFSIVDTGIGISSEDQNRLFEEFLQIDSRLNRKHNGTGLGLSLVRRLTELHGGSISVDSEVGKGSRFTVTLPYEQPATDFQPTSPTTMPKPSTTAAETPASGETTKAFVLLAEDNEANISTMSSYLNLRGYQVLVAKNGQQAVEMAIAQQPDCILMDIQMPEMDGLEAMRQIRSYPQLVQTPIIALTALAMAGDREKCLEAGANEYITKPVRLKQLSETIRALLGKSADSR